MLLAQLLARGGDRELLHARGIALVGQDAGQRVRGAEVGLVCHEAVVVTFDERHATPREFHDRLLPRRLGEEAQRLGGEVVVLLVERVAPDLGQREHLRRAAATAGAVHLLVARLERAVTDEVVEVAADGGRREVEPRGQHGGGGGAVDEDRPYDALARRLVPSLVRSEFHNASVPLMVRLVQARVP